MIARKAIKLDYEVYLLSNLADIENKKKLNENKIHYIQIPITRSSKNVFSEIFLFFSIFFNLFKLRPKITHLVTVKPIIYGGIISRILNLNVLFAITGLNYIDYIFNNKKKLINKFFIPFFKKVYNFIFKNKNAKIIIQNNDDYAYFINNYKINKKYLSYKRLWC